MTKTPEQMALEYAKTEGQPWGCERHFLAGYEAATDKCLEQIRHLEMELQQAKLLAMKLEAER